MSKPRYFRVDGQGETVIFTAVNSLGSLVEDDVREEWDLLLEQLDLHHARNVVVDLAALDYFGSIMLELLVVLWKRVSSRKGKLAICNPSPVGREILETAKFHTIWPILDSRAAALAAVQATDG